MRGGDSLRRDVLRMAANAAYNVEKRNQRPLTEDELAFMKRHTGFGPNGPGAIYRI